MIYEEGFAMAEQSARENLAVLIMAGGMGTRFWPASRESVPKQFLPICGTRSMLEACFRRIESLTDPSKILVIINARHGSLTREILRGTGAQIVEEPFGRNTAPCIGLGCIHIMKSFGDLPTIALPADHYISGEEEFRRCLRQGVSLLKDRAIVTLGIPPSYPETGYGYIEQGPALGRGGAFQVNGFIEKPGLEKARRFLASRNYLWNAGIFLFRPSTMLKEIETYLPDVRRGLERISETINTDLYPSRLEEEYRQMNSISIDYGVVERTKKPIYVIRGDFEWSDVGNWAALRRLRVAEADGDGNVVSKKSILLDAKNTFIHSQSNRLIAVLGLENLLVVDTEDVLLIADIKQSQGVRRLPEVAREKGWNDAT